MRVERRAEGLKALAEVLHRRAHIILQRADAVIPTAIPSAGEEDGVDRRKSRPVG